MKAISLYQPYASAVALGLKKNETRGRPWDFVGTIAICSTKTVPDKFRRYAADDELIAKAFIATLRPNLKHDERWPEIGQELLDSLPVGRVVAVAFKDGCRQSKVIVQEKPSALEIALGDYSDGRFYYPLRNVIPLMVPVPVKGGQFVFELPQDVGYDVQKQLHGHHCQWCDRSWKHEHCGECGELHHVDAHCDNLG